MMTENEAIKELNERIELIEKDYKEGMGEYKEVLETAVKSLEEVQQYRAIGTVEECREAMEKQKPKKPDVWGDGYDDELNMIYDMYSCPNCGEEYEIDYAKHDFCPHCGQAIDWSDGEESLPHTYNVGRVIERLESVLSICEDYHRKHGNCGNQIYAYKKALKIVKSGGLEE